MRKQTAAPVAGSASGIGKLVSQQLDQEIQTSYLSYAMSVIVARALPDVRDGLKPVTRRILYSMWNLGLRSTAKFRKSAHVVGDVMAKYHPHGDAPIYEALARMAQDFSMRYELIDGQGNWGSIDGDAPAAQRYTEARLAKIADELLQDIDKETVDFISNYDATHQEPRVLPSRLPQFLLNGSVGIAVGMATSCPPHNLVEVCNALIHLIDNPTATIEELMQFIQGPDFPTGAAIYDKREIRQAYATGKGSIVTRALASIEETAKGNNRIIVTQIPYLVNKAALITKIAELVKDKRLEGIKDLRDESDREGIRIVIELKKDAIPKKVLNRLYVTTDLQRAFHVNMLALVDSGRQPKVLTLKEVLEEHIKHRQEVIHRRTQYDLTRAKERAHILEGLKTALDHIDEVIALIKRSKTKESAHVNLCQRFALTAAQATAILEMRLQTLAGLERQKIEDELKEKQVLIKELTNVLGSPKRILGIIKDEYKVLKTNYPEERRTRIFARPAGEFSTEDLVPDEPCIITITRGGYIKRMVTAGYHVQRRGGKGVRGVITKEEDVVDLFLATTTHKELLLFTNRGRVFSIRAYDIPITNRAAKGQALVNFLELAPEERVTALQVLPAQEDKAEYLIMATRNGLIKKTQRDEFTNIRRAGLRAITLKNNDALEWVTTSGGNDQVLLVTAAGQAIRFNEKSIRDTGRTAAGVRGIRCKAGDAVVAMHIIPTGINDKQEEVIVVTEKGYGKRTQLATYRLQGRGGSGIKTAKVTAKTGKVTNAVVLTMHRINETDLLIISERGQVIRVAASAVSRQGRATQGVRVMRPAEQNSNVATFTAWSEQEAVGT